MQDRVQTPELRDYVRILWRRKLWVLIPIVAALLISVTICKIETPVYRAQGTVMVGGPGGMLTSGGGSRSRSNKSGGTSSPFAMNPYNLTGVHSMVTQEQIIESRTFAEDTARVVVEQRDAIRSLRNVDFSRDDLEALYRRVADVLGRPPKDTGRRPPMARLQAGIVGETDIISISAESPDKEQACDFSNAACVVFIARSLNETRQAMLHANRYVQDNLTKARTALAKAENDLEGFMTKSGGAGFDAQTTALWTARSTVETGMFEALAGQEATSAQVARLRGAIPSLPKSVMDSKTLARKPVLDDLTSRIAQAEIDRRQALEQFKPESTRVKALTAQLNHLKKRYAEEVAAGAKVVEQEQSHQNPVYYDLLSRLAQAQGDNMLASARARKAREALAGMDRRITALPAKETEYARLMRDENLAEQQYLNLMDQQTQLSISVESADPASSILDNATLPRKPVRPDLRINIAGALVVGIFLGLGLVLLAEHLDDTFRAPDEVELRLGIPLLGAIPPARKGREHTLMQDRDKRSPILEAFRTLRSNLRFMSPDKRLDSLLVTAAGEKEGKTTVAANIANSFAETGLRVMLVDCDLRKPSVHEFFAVEQSPGLTGVIVGESSLEEAIKPTRAANLWVIPAGVVPPRPTELLESQKMQDIVQQLRGEYDLVVFDSPPVLSSADSQVLSAAIRSTVFVVDLPLGRRGPALQAKDLLLRANARLVGVVVNRVPMEQTGYCYYYGDEPS